MITKETHTIDWNKTAQIAGVVLVALAQTAWWLTKRLGKVAATILTVLAKVFVALASVWASIPEPEADTEKRDPSFGYNHLGEWVEGGSYSIPPKSR